jgi:GntR family transcriptional regulator, transcriptional repressor for pyruvate dehydrogenase complex
MAKVAPSSPVDWTAMPIRASKLSDAVYDVLERLITSGQLPPGSRLPAERQLSTQLGVSRNSVREAVHELELKRLVERRSGRGTVVLDAAAGNPHGSLLDEVTAADRDLAEIMDFRLAVEPPIAALAAERTTRGNLRRLAAVLDDMARQSEPGRVAQLDYDFHAAVARTTQNRLLIRLHEISSEWLRKSRRDALQSQKRRAASLDGHRRIYAAIAAHDASAAHEAMVDHVLEVRKIIDAARES